MNKIYFAISAVFLVIASTFGVFAQTATPVEQVVVGDVLDFLELSVTPGSVDFGDIPFSQDLDMLALNSPVMIDFGASSTESGTAGLSVQVIDTLGATFFSDLLHFTMIDFTEMPVNGYSLTGVQLPAEPIAYPIKLLGNVQNYDAGPKSATIVYTALAEPPSLP